VIGYLFFVAEDKGRIIGFVFVYFSPAILKSGWINEIFVTEAFRRNGIGSKLLEKGIEWLKQKNAKKVELKVYKINQEALSFYKKHHFKKQPAKFIRLERKIK
jgi:GNAT superfamily N-acetyltransferase